MITVISIVNMISIFVILKCKETSSIGNNAEHMEAGCENCLRPLMDYFELVLSAQANACEKTVLKRLLKVKNFIC